MDAHADKMVKMSNSLVVKPSWCITKSVLQNELNWHEWWQQVATRSGILVCCVARHWMVASAAGPHKCFDTATGGRGRVGIVSKWKSFISIVKRTIWWGYLDRATMVPSLFRSLEKVWRSMTMWEDSPCNRSLIQSDNFAVPQPNSMNVVFFWSRLWASKWLIMDSSWSKCLGGLFCLSLWGDDKSWYGMVFGRYGDARFNLANRIWTSSPDTLDIGVCVGVVGGKDDAFDWFLSILVYNHSAISRCIESAGCLALFLSLLSDTPSPHL